MTAAQVWIRQNCRFAQSNIRALAQDYWLQVMTPDQRAEVMNKAPKPKSLLGRLRACHQYVIDNVPEFQQYVQEHTQKTIQ